MNKKNSIIFYLKKIVKENKEKEKYIGKTPLMIACQGNKRDIVKYLCEHGADSNITNTNGKKASDYTTDPQIKNDLMEGCHPVTSEQPVTEGGRRRRRACNRRTRRHRKYKRSSTRNKRRTTPSCS